MTLQLHTFGKPELRLRSPQVGDVVVPAVQQKHIAVLTYIALSPERRASRRVLAALLWGDTADSDDRHGLRSSLSLLRTARALGPQSLSSGDRETISLEIPIWVDSAEFERLVASGEYEAAIAMYRGKFFQDWALPGCDGFEEWAAGRRSHYSALFCSAAREFCARLSDVGRAPAAVAVAERVRDENPLDPMHWRLLIETRIGARDFVRAAADADSVERMAEIEGVELDKTMRVLLRRARDREWTASADEATEETRLQTPEMVGRAHEFSSLLQVWNRSVAGRYAHVQLIAVPGLGKSRLMQELAARLHARRARVVVVRADVVLRGVAFGLVARLVRELSRLPGAAALAPSTIDVLVGLDSSLGEIFRQSTPAFPPALDALRLRALALRDLIAAVSNDRPLAVLVDDLHWGDASSLVVLSATFAQIESSPVLLVSTARPGLVGGPAASSRFDLRPLTLDAVREMVQSIAVLGERPWSDAFVEHVHRVSQGSPFLVLQTLSSGLDQGLIDIQPDGWECRSIDAFVSSTTVDAIVTNRVADLNPAERFALLVVGYAAASLAHNQLTGAVERAVSSSDALARLERRGLVDSASGTLRVTHDEIFDAAIAASGAHDLATARRAVAHALVDAGSTDADKLRQAGMHFVESGDSEEEVAVFARYVTAHRLVGDRRSLLELGREFRGSESEAEVRALVASLPRSIRERRRGETPTIVGTFGFAAVLLLFFLTRRDVPSARLWVFSADMESPDAAWVAEMREDRWDSHAPIVLAGPTKQPFHNSFAAHSPQRPGHALWAVQYEPGDSGGTEVGLLRPTGEITRLTNSVGEDTPSGWSPDGRFLLIGTSRWSKERHLKTAVYDIESQTIRPLHNNPGFERSALWSPDGSRIAFVRRSYSQQPNALCWVFSDGSSLRCADFLEQALVEVALWQSPTEIVVTADSAGQRALYRYGLIDDQVVRIAMPERVGQCSVSADNIWLACAPNVARTSRLDEWRRLSSREGAPQSLRWQVERQSPWKIDSLSIASVRDTIPIGVPFRLDVEAFSHIGASDGYGALRWHSSNVRVAEIDSSGTIFARRSGSVTITVSAGGWRSASRQIVIAGTDPVAVRTTDWESPDSQWVRFGDPLPFVQDAPFGRALNVNGDGHYFSGVYSSRTLSTTRGVGIEADLSTPVSRMQWQYINFGFATLDSAALARFSGKHSFLPTVRGAIGCNIAYPQDEGAEGARRLTGLNELLPSADRTPPYPAVADGRTWRVRVQILPDGRCGVAINGQPIFIRSREGSQAEYVNMIVQGHSVDTRILVGNVRFWTGVLSDVDWTSLLPARQIPGLSAEHSRSAK